MARISSSDVMVFGVSGVSTQQQQQQQPASSTLMLTTRHDARPFISVKRPVNRQLGGAVKFLSADISQKKTRYLTVKILSADFAAPAKTAEKSLLPSKNRHYVSD